MFKYKILFFLAIALSGCKYFDRKKATKIVVARVGDKILYADDFVEIFSSAQTPEDSVKLRENYIQKWVHDEVLFLNALNNLTDSLKDKQGQLDQYYRSLIRYEYEKGLIVQRLDTAVNSKNIIDYYNQFNESFILKRKVIKSLYVLLPNDLPKKETVMQWMKEGTPEDIDSLQKYCLRYGVKFNLKSNKWFYLDDIMSDAQLPISFEVYRSSTPLTYMDSMKSVIIRVDELRLPGHPMPLQLAGPTIRNIIKNRNKVAFISKMETDVLEEAQRKGKFEIY